MKTRPVGDDLLHTDGRTDMTKLIVVLCNFANSPKTVRGTSHALVCEWPQAEGV